MTFLKWLLSLFIKNPYFTGVLKDSRTDSEKAQDYLHDELVQPAAPVDPFGNVQLTVSPYAYVNQNGTSSCVSHAVTLALAIERKTATNNYSDLSKMFLYRLRSNYPGEGTVPQEAFQTLKSWGAPLYDTLPNAQTEVEANAVKLTQQMYNEAAIFKGNLYFKITAGNDITEIAKVLQQGHPVTVCLYATYDEYALQTPVIINPALKQGNAEINHEVCILPYSGFILNGVKYVAVQDSAWFGGWKLRYFSEAFIKARVTEARYWTTVAILSTGPAPKHVFTQSLTIGAKGDEVIYAQKLLISEGLLPADCATGYFGGLTLAGVKAFQEKYAADILLPNGLMAPTGYWGPATIKKANILCS